MRQPQHRNRARARSRRQPNPANKVYESNGPDVKVRGTPQQIADKYAQLGRDALSAGDMVKAENYFQHAEHYLRIIAAAQEQIQQRRAQQEQRRQEAAARRKGNGSATEQAEQLEQPDVPTPEEAGEGAQVVVLPTEAATSEEPADAAAQEQPVWEESPPEFLTRPVEVPDGADADSSDDAATAEQATQPQEDAPARKTTRRRRTTRTPRARKSSSSANSAGNTGSASGEAAGD